MLLKRDRNHRTTRPVISACLPASEAAGIRTNQRVFAERGSDNGRKYFGLAFRWADIRALSDRRIALILAPSEVRFWRGDWAMETPSPGPFSQTWEQTVLCAIPGISSFNGQAVTQDFLRVERELSTGLLSGLFAQ